MHNRNAYSTSKINDLSVAIFFIVLGFGQCTLHAQWKEPIEFPGADRDDALGLTSGSTSLFFGGNLNGAQGGERVYAFNWETMLWTEKSPFPGVKRQYHGGFVINSIGYVIGGYADTGTALKDFWRYDFQTDTWLQLPDFPSDARWSFASFVINNKAYIVGGTTELDRTAEVWSFDVQTETWMRMKDFPGGKRRENIGAAHGPIGYMGLGFDAFDEAGHFSDWWKYDPQNDVWTRLNDYPGGALSYVQAQSCTNGIWVGGGMDFNKVPTANAFMYDVLNKVWIPTDSIASGATSGASSIFYKNRIGLLTGLNRNKIRETQLMIYEWQVDHPGDWLVYPNPASPNSLITLQGLAGQEGMVYNLHGKMNTAFKLNDLGQYFLDLPKGVYWLSPPVPSSSKPIQLLVR